MAPGPHRTQGSKASRTKGLLQADVEPLNSRNEVDEFLLDKIDSVPAP